MQGCDKGRKKQYFLTRMGRYQNSGTFWTVDDVKIMGCPILVYAVQTDTSDMKIGSIVYFIKEQTAVQYPNMQS